MLAPRGNVTAFHGQLTAIGSAPIKVEPALERKGRGRLNKAADRLETVERLRYFDVPPEADQVALLEATLAMPGQREEHCRQADRAVEGRLRRYDRISPARCRGRRRCCRRCC
jgi:anti-sigma factor ChrR (cupin superfamily)